MLVAQSEKNRKKIPRFGKKIKIGETEAKHTQNLLALKYKDKREVFMLSTMHKNEFANTNKRDKVTNLPIQKPSAVIDYNQKMGSVDQTDMLLSSIGCLRKSLKWYKKLFFHFIDTSLLNAYSLYLVNTGKRPSLAEFHINLIGQIIEKYHEARVQVHRGRPSTSEDRPLRFIERHFPSLVPPTEKKKNPTRYCRVCGANKKRKESRYMCKDCDVALCVDIEFCVSARKEKYIKTFIATNKRWPNCTLEPYCPEALVYAHSHNKSPSDPKVQRLFGKVESEHYAYITLGQEMGFDQHPHMLGLIQDIAISVLQSGVFKCYLDKTKRAKPEDTRLLLHYLIKSDASSDQARYMAQYCASDPDMDVLLDYMVVRLIPKEKELKTEPTFFAAKSMEDRNRTNILGNAVEGGRASPRSAIIGKY
ncbi:hypothetical protein LAZ67_10002323 [Cordylochernes scorpioides]|uniref:PiggyBac transposable element-derived protein domain-containing protein n=1 Tax=Cordylochernes scorpioides TaxID=51811 RepID=A0ABY6KWL1_9ARAC|nr:hypothetical protein LAZ67_10002323 [Cordylochernes scorpioides]